jgi:predicted nuclease of predicted toxin-antitoxin system
MKILIDMNLSPLWVRFFADRDIESIHWGEVGDHSASDHQIFRYARENNLIVFTNDLDFEGSWRKRAAASRV